MAVAEQQRGVGIPEQGNLVRVRDRFWVVESVIPSRPLPTMDNGGGSMTHNAVRLVPMDDKGSPDPLTVYWELEPGTDIRPQVSLPDPADGLDDNETFSAFLDAARWGAVAAADPTAFQSPFRAGIDIKDYQLLPLVRALAMPRVSLLIADGRGFGQNHRGRSHRRGTRAARPSPQDHGGVPTQLVREVAAGDAGQVRPRFRNSQP